MFHLETAADCGSLEAILLMAHIYLGMPHDVLPNISMEVTLSLAVFGDSSLAKFVLNFKCLFTLFKFNA